MSPATAQYGTHSGDFGRDGGASGIQALARAPGCANADTGSTSLSTELPQESFAETVGNFGLAENRLDPLRLARHSLHPDRASNDRRRTGAARGRRSGGKRPRDQEIHRGHGRSAKQHENHADHLQPHPCGPTEPKRRGGSTALVALGRVLTLDEKVARLTFKFRAVAPFQTVEAESGTALLGIVDKTGPSDAKPSIMINRAGTTAGPAETPQVSERLLRGLAGFNNAQISEQAPATFAGGQGYFISAVAGNLTLLQFTRVLPGGRYVRLAARGETAALENVRDAVKEIASSVEIPEQ